MSAALRFAPRVFADHGASRGKKHPLFTGGFDAPMTLFQGIVCLEPSFAALKA
jgi:hypothetical protein